MSAESIPRNPPEIGIEANPQVDCVITNPPFGGYEEDGVGSDYPADLRTRETSDTFMALIIKNC